MDAVTRLWREWGGTGAGAGAGVAWNAVTSRHQSAREGTEEDKKINKKCCICSILKYISLVNRSQGLEKKKKEHSRI